MKKLAILILALATFCMAACPKVYQDSSYKGFTIYELPNKTVFICEYEYGCSEKLYTYFVLDNKKAKIVETQVNTGDRLGTLKTYDSENRVIHETFHDYRRQALRNALETERANCLIKN